ncbi:SGNH/GDSL hydrolase family protein [Nocardioides sambongensis]|uniref:SGNH/GDSL hydrolase family protein n=1 Tax=Nocardioides sambongensis TaxID=2589074 RepID=UPI00112B114B|nr:SGNH/GDSL hydrolase family protein [Nocardioides sambongensis]
MRTLSSLVVVGLLGAGLAAVGAAPAQADPVDPPGWDNGPGGERYVAFGDSFVSGPGILPQRPGICARSEKNFPTLVAKRLGVTTFTDASCGGATTEDYWAPQAQGGSENPAQLDALDADTTLVTLGTMGGNDVGLVGIATSCFTSDCVGSDDDAHHQAIDALAPVYRDLVDEVRERSPEAEIVAVGYGTYVPPTSCPALPGVTPAEAVYLQGLIDHMSDVIGAVAEEEGIAFADMRTIPGAVDHTPCADPDEQWIRAISTYNDGAPMHPSTAGMRMMAGEVLQTIQQARGTQRALAGAADSIQLRAHCLGMGPAKRLRVVVRGGNGLTDRVTVRVGRQQVGVVQTAPWRITPKVRAIKPGNRDGRVRAQVRLTRDGAVKVATIARPAPRCVRRR